MISLMIQIPEDAYENILNGDIDLRAFDAIREAKVITSQPVNGYRDTMPKPTKLFYDIRVENPDGNLKQPQWKDTVNYL